LSHIDLVRNLRCFLITNSFSNFGLNVKSKWLTN
jgi:hypothetical protein